MLKSIVSLMLIAATLTISGCATNIKNGENFTMEIKGSGELKNQVVLETKNAVFTTDEAGRLRCMATFRNVSGHAMSGWLRSEFFDKNQRLLEVDRQRFALAPEQTFDWQTASPVSGSVNWNFHVDCDITYFNQAK